MVRHPEIQVARQNVTGGWLDIVKIGKQPVTLEGSRRMLLYKCLKFSSLWKRLLLDWG